MEQLKSDDDNDPSILTLIVDTNPLAWKLRRQFGTESMIDINELIAQLIIYCHAYALLHRSNRIIVIANHPAESVVIYPRRKSNQTAGQNGTDGSVNRDDFVPFCHTLQTVISTGLLACVRNDAESRSQNGSAENDKNPRTEVSGEGSSSLAQALSISLCAINRQLQQHPKLQPRIMVVQLAKDQSATYNSVMNSIFSAQKLGVAVDALVLSKEDSRFLQQACLLTRGVYQRPADQRDLLQLMLSHNLPSIRTRGVLNVPMQKLVDFRASCFCHQRPVEFAFMCSVCLALTCEIPGTSCGTCGTAARKVVVR